MYSILKNWAGKQNPTDPLAHLMPVELVSMPNLAPALLLPVYVGTLADYPFDIRMVELFARAATSMEAALDKMHLARLVHCDVKPDNIFVSSAGECVLGDYDAAVQMGSRVERTTQRYLPVEMVDQLNNGALYASAAIDYAMLAMALLDCLGEKVEEKQHEHTLSWIGKYGTVDPAVLIQRSGLTQTSNDYRQRLITSFEVVIAVLKKCHARVTSEFRAPMQLSSS